MCEKVIPILEKYGYKIEYIQNNDNRCFSINKKLAPLQSMSFHDLLITLVFAFNNNNVLEIGRFTSTAVFNDTWHAADALTL